MTFLKIHAILYKPLREEEYMGTYVINGERIHAASRFQAQYAYKELMKSRSKLPQDKISRARRTQVHYQEIYGAYDENINPEK